MNGARKGQSGAPRPVTVSKPFCALTGSSAALLLAARPSTSDCRPLRPTVTSRNTPLSAAYAEYSAPWMSPTPLVTPLVASMLVNSAAASGEDRLVPPTTVVLVG